MPKKPTQPFGSIAINRERGVWHDVHVLPSEKSLQEEAAFSRFVQLFNVSYQNRPISDVKQLLEADHDFQAAIDGRAVAIQLAELSDFSFAFPPGDPRYDPRARAFMVKGREEDQGKPWSIDVAKRDSALRNLVEGKIGKRYALTRVPLWLVVFSVAPLYEMETWQEGGPTRSTALKHVDTYLAAEAMVPFSEIWYCDLQTRPVAIWPRANWSRSTNESAG